MAGKYSLITTHLENLEERAKKIRKDLVALKHE
jgi:hypothetical protein